MFRHFLSSFPVAIAASALSIGLLATPSQAITTWNWSFTTDISDQYGSGTFTTSDVIPTAFTTYSILDIDGTYARDGSTYAIVGLGSYVDPDNVFQWDGTALSSIISTYPGITFDTPGGEVNLFEGTGSGFKPVEYTVSTFSGADGDGDIVSSSLTPVPGPLPVFGAAAAYSWSRRMRRRIAEKA